MCLLLIEMSLLSSVHRSLLIIWYQTMFEFRHMIVNSLLMCCSICQCVSADINVAWVAPCEWILYIWNSNPMTMQEFDWHLTYILCESRYHSGKWVYTLSLNNTSNVHVVSFYMHWSCTVWNIFHQKWIVSQIILIPPSLIENPLREGAFTRLNCSVVHPISPDHTILIFWFQMKMQHRRHLLFTASSTTFQSHSLLTTRMPVWIPGSRVLWKAEQNTNTRHTSSSKRSFPRLVLEIDLCLVFTNDMFCN